MRKYGDSRSSDKIRNPLLKYETFHASLLFFSTDQFPYTIIQAACDSPWCHVAMLLKLKYSKIRELHEALNGSRHGRDVYPLPAKYAKGDPNLREYFVLESTSEILRCFFTGTLSTGVKLTPAVDRLTDYEGVLGIKPIVFKRERNRTAFDRELYAVYVALANRPYERNLLHLVSAWIHWLLSPCCTCYVSASRCGDFVYRSSEDLYNGDDLTSVFCTELIAYVLSKTGVFSERLDIGALVLNDFWELNTRVAGRNGGPEYVLGERCPVIIEERIEATCTDFVLRLKEL